ncbi:hypothetical protein CVT24_007345 [Panaeolus cyanescens]|uniref:Uncharacterized protein n=1 Tax=Panaeolus cyanescens TaxID=181874 RepID=A0A409YW86_9AGAR|nr:hypothetical protein CVT24_007345 [Panaeolus cyanescens]
MSRDVTGPYSYDFVDQYQTQLEECTHYLYGFPPEVCPRIDPVPVTPPNGTLIRYLPSPQEPAYDWFCTPPTSPACSPTPTNISELESELESEATFSTAPESTDGSKCLGRPRPSSMLSCIPTATGDGKEMGFVKHEEGKMNMEDGLDDWQRVDAFEGDVGQGDMVGGSGGWGEEEEDGDDADVIPAIRPCGIKHKHRIVLPLRPVSPYRTPSPEVDEEFWRAAGRPHNQGEAELVLGEGYLRDYFDTDL